ncbi:hypothetical protein RRG08_022349 [Elysia crispata]|uniref:Uncharacterized protein n=1 Tax=Elysia crispata TaxID=231223 RepID=A0AAE0Z296_9GAST|nr:hypothetical protein RRG08_022349 [Elysia crispata]
MPWPKRPANSAGWKTCWAALSATLSVKSGRLRGGEEGGVGGRPHDIDTEYNNRSSDKISRDKSWEQDGRWSGNQSGARGVRDQQLVASRLLQVQHLNTGKLSFRCIPPETGTLHLIGE